MRRRVARTALSLAVLALLATVPGELLAARKKVKKTPVKAKTSVSRKGKAPKPKAAPRPTPAPTVTPGPLYGPPAPVLKRAAGTCVAFEPGQYLMLAEVGGVGRIFTVRKFTRIEAHVVPGARIRILYEDLPEGPQAREILPGPIEVGR